VSISGTHIVAGAYLESEDAAGAATLSTAGSAYIFTRSGTNWTQQQKLVSADRTAADQFGQSVAISGGTVLAGAWLEDENVWGGNTLNSAGSAYIFESPTIIALPIHLLSFTARQESKTRNRIDWTSALETLGSSYEVQRSADGAAFVTIGSLPAKGTPGAYTFYDAQPLSPINYYRLKMNSDAEITYSRIVSVNNESINNTVIVYPIPASRQITVTTNNTAILQTMASISDMQGRVIYRFRLNASNQVDVHGWPAGIYNLRLQNGELIRIVKQ